MQGNMEVDTCKFPPPSKTLKKMKEKNQMEVGEK